MTNLALNTPTPELVVTLTVTQLQTLIAQAVADGVRAAQGTTAHRLAYTVKEAAQITGKTEWTVREAIRKGELHATSAGGKSRQTIHHAELDAWARGVAVPSSKGRRA